jgi:hypothetical protein
MLAGFPFGCGYVLLFLALLNYLADAYKTFAASAMAASACSRSVCWCCLAIRHHPDVPESRRGVGNLSPCIFELGLFLWKGDALRKRNTLCTHLREIKQKELAELASERTQKDQLEKVAEEASEKV